MLSTNVLNIQRCRVRSELCLCEIVAYKKKVVRISCCEQARARLHTSARYLLITRVCAFSKVKHAFCFKHGIFWKKSSRFLKKQKVGQRVHTVRCLRELRACLCTNAWHSLAAKIIQLAYSMFGGNLILNRYRCKK